MSSPCLLRTAPISQPQLREVKISVKASSRETTAIRSSSGGAKEASSRSYMPPEKEAPVRVSVSSSRSRSTPPVHRAQRPESRKSSGGSTCKQQQQPEHHPEKNGTILHVPLGVAPTGLSLFSSSSSSSSSCTSRRQRPSRPHVTPAPTPLLLSSSSSSSSAKSMKRARWLSYSTSNICFNSILDGRFRQLQGTGSWWQSCACVFVCVFVHPLMPHRHFSNYAPHLPNLGFLLGRGEMAGRSSCELSKCEASLSSCCKNWKKAAASKCKLHSSCHFIKCIWL